MIIIFNKKNIQLKITNILFNSIINKTNNKK